MKHFAPPAPARPGRLRQWLMGRDEPEPADAQPAEASHEAEMLAAMIGEACAAVAATGQVLRRSGEDALAYRAALEDEAGRLDPADPGAMARRLVALTQAMVERTHAAEARLQAMGAEMASLQATLAEARTEADHDALTGLPNRRAIAARLADAIARAAATQAALSLAYCDIDHFKKINDTHGHDVGDRVLRMVADTLADGAGADGFVGRQGGEEFVVILEGADADTAIARVDAIRASLADRAFRSRSTGESIGRVSFSAGVAQWEGDGDADLVRRADAALYRAKDEGRNRVTRG